MRLQTLLFCQLLTAGIFVTTTVCSIAQELTPDETRAIARDAYVYGFPLVDNYRINHTYFVAKTNREYKAPWNQIRSTPRVYTPADKAIQTPNSDTPYSTLGMDLRAEPLVLTVPRIEAGRYFSVQLIDGYTHNFAYIGTRATGNAGGHFLIAGPDWNGEVPEGITAMFPCETQLAWAMYRTQLFNPDDLENVKNVQEGYKVQTLSTFLGTSAPAALPPIEFIQPLTPQEQRESLDFFKVLNFVLERCPTHPSEVELMKRFGRLNVGRGKTFDPEKLSPAQRESIGLGMADAWKQFNEFKSNNMDTGKVTSGDCFGTREFLKNNYIHRMTGAILGIYGNSREEAMYPLYFVDQSGQKLDGSKSGYRLRFAPDQFPPVDAFWSLTLYELPSSLLSDNSLNRYLINSPMLPSLKRDEDGGVTLYVQHTSPGKELESNWLPAPSGPFWLILRLYQPQSAAISGTWTQPPLTRIALKDMANSGAIETVTPENYIRAETDRNFQNIYGLTGKINTLFHFRNPTSLEKQTVVRMNKDTLYSAAIVDTEGGATVTLPEMPKGRYMSILLLDNDHYCPGVIYEPGTHSLPTDTRYLAVVVRTQLFNAEDPEELKLVNDLQDKVSIHASSAVPIPPMKWDPVSLKALTEQYEKESAEYSSWKGMMGPRGKVNEENRHIACAAAWGLFPEADATYLNYNGNHDFRKGYKATYAVPENQAFWSITVYGRDGYMKHMNSIVNSSNVKLNPDGTFTVHFGSRDVCGDVPNRIDVADGWNYLMRIYRPGPSVLDGTYKLPIAEEMP